MGIPLFLGKILEFAKDLRQLVEDFEEEMEILADQLLMEQIKENKKEKEKGNTRIFNDLKDLEKELES
ncbi:MAG: hypothetical protein PVF58_18895 [Candidatus Methanofastidiosia archaeon]